MTLNFVKNYFLSFNFKIYTCILRKTYNSQKWFVFKKTPHHKSRYVDNIEIEHQYY